MKSGIILFIVFSQIVACKSSKTCYFVKDNARVLPLTFIKSLNQNICSSYSKTEVQFIVYTINSISGIKKPDAYSEDLIRKTDFGRSGFRNSVVMVLYPDEGFLSLRWGDNLVSRIDSLKANSIIDSMKSFFIKKDFSVGVNYGVNKVYSLIE